jgi:hypothetical protein
VKKKQKYSSGREKKDHVPQTLRIPEWGFAESEEVGEEIVYTNDAQRHPQRRCNAGLWGEWIKINVTIFFGITPKRSG